MSLSEDFPYALLAYHTEGFSIGSVQKIIDQVMIPSRIQRMEVNELTLSEFVEPLAEEEYISAEQYENFKDFTWQVCFFKELNEKKKLLEKDSAKNAKKKK